MPTHANVIAAVADATRAAVSHPHPVAVAAAVAAAAAAELDPLAEGGCLNDGVTVPTRRLQLLAIDDVSDDDAVAV